MTCIGYFSNSLGNRSIFLYKILYKNKNHFLINATLENAAINSGTPEDNRRVDTLRVDESARSPLEGTIPGWMDGSINQFKITYFPLRIDGFDLIWSSLDWWGCTSQIMDSQHKGQHNPPFIRHVILSAGFWEKLDWFIFKSCFPLPPSLPFFVFIRIPSNFWKNKSSFL